MLTNIFKLIQTALLIFSTSIVISCAVITTPLDNKMQEPLDVVLQIESDVVSVSIKNTSQTPVQYFDSLRLQDTGMPPHYSFVQIKTIADVILTASDDAPDGWISPYFTSSNLLSIPTKLSTIDPGQTIEYDWPLSSMLLGFKLRPEYLRTPSTRYELKVRVDIILDRKFENRIITESSWVPVTSKMITPPPQLGVLVINPEN
jgi:hypothetical protein